MFDGNIATFFSNKFYSLASMLISWVSVNRDAWSCVQVNMYAHPCAREVYIPSYIVDILFSLPEDIFFSLLLKREEGRERTVM